MLTVGRLTYTTETMTLNYALEALTLGGSLDVYEVVFAEEVNGDSVTELYFFAKSFELGQVALGSYSGLLEVTGHGVGCVLLFLLLEAELHGGIAVLVNRFHLSNYAGAYFDNSARHVLAVGTENGCHSDFLS